MTILWNEACGKFVHHQSSIKKMCGIATSLDACVCVYLQAVRNNRLPFCRLGHLEGAASFLPPLFVVTNPRGVHAAKWQQRRGNELLLLINYTWHHAMQATRFVTSRVLPPGSSYNSRTFPGFFKVIWELFKVPKIGIKAQTIHLAKRMRKLLIVSRDIWCDPR